MFHYFKTSLFLWLALGLMFSSPYFSWCGDGFIDGNEQCDLGLKNNDDVSISGCKKNCTVQTTGKWTCTKTYQDYNDAQTFLEQIIQSVFVTSDIQEAHSNCGTGKTLTLEQRDSCNLFIAYTIKFIDLNKNTKLSDTFIKKCTQGTTIADYNPNTMARKVTPYTIRCTNDS